MSQFTSADKFVETVTTSGWVIMPDHATPPMLDAIRKSYWTNRNLDMVYDAAVRSRPAAAPAEKARMEMDEYQVFRDVDVRSIFTSQINRKP